ncbi:MAG: ABC transporter ATP-binding protein [Acidobacteriota bacterium]
MAFLEIRDVAKSFGDVRVLEGLDIELGEGEILALLGLSGSGKTTALRLLAGFETPDRGSVRVDGDDVTGLGPAARGFGMVFQHYALFPHMSVAENVAFGLEARRWDAARTTERVDEMLALVDLAGYGERKVSAISGGQQQRVALARALAPEPRLLLLDEPLSNLDPALRERTRTELREAVRRVGITTVLVTHEQEEAFHLGDRIAVLHHGRLQQVGSAADLYRRPATRFVAGFVGRSSRLRGTIEAINGETATVRIGEAIWPATVVDPAEAGETVDLVVRPEALAFAAEGLPGVVEELRFTGLATYALVRVDGHGELAQVLVDDEPSTGDRVHVALRDPATPAPRLFAPEDA